MGMHNGYEKRKQNIGANKTVCCRKRFKISHFLCSKHKNTFYKFDELSFNDNTSSCYSTLS